MKNIQPNIAYIIDPRFAGGTSAAVASELKVVARLGCVNVHAVSSKMFSGFNVAPKIRKVLQELRLKLIWDAPTISADIVLLHNPSFLKFDEALNAKIIARHLIVIAHENFYRPGRKESFDVAKCLDMIAGASLSMRKSIAPISAYNRTVASDWLATNRRAGTWSVLQDDWFNICDFEMQPPVDEPSDRRGRHSRPGLEKFPGMAVMDLCFPKTAQANVILGADLFLDTNLNRPHWDMTPFQGLEVARYFEMIDFMVYFTAPTWRESFGRVLAESIAAGKVTISDPETASTFDGAVVAAMPAQVDGIIAEFVQNPARYHRQVARGQKKLTKFSSTAFQHFFQALMHQNIGVAA